FYIHVEQFGLGRPTDAEFPHCSEHAKARHIRSYNESGESGNSLTASLDRSLSERRNHTGAMCVSDPDLVSLQYPPLAVSAQLGSCLDVLRIRACLWFRKRVRRQSFSTRE